MGRSAASLQHLGGVLLLLLLLLACGVWAVLVPACGIVPQWMRPNGHCGHVRVLSTRAGFTCVVPAVMGGLCALECDSAALRMSCVCLSLCASICAASACLLNQLNTDTYLCGACAESVRERQRGFLHSHITCACRLCACVWSCSCCLRHDIACTCCRVNCTEAAATNSWVLLTDCQFGIYIWWSSQQQRQVSVLAAAWACLCLPQLLLCLCFQAGWAGCWHAPPACVPARASTCQPALQQLFCMRNSRVWPATVPVTGVCACSLWVSSTCQWLLISAAQ